MDDHVAGGSGGAAPRRADSATRPRANVAALESAYQLLLWLVPMLDGMPRRQKFQIADRLQNQMQDVLEALIEAAYTRERSALLRRANLGLEKLRYGLRLAKDLELLPFKKYEHAARLADSLGRQIGGWLRSERPAAATAASAAPQALGDGQAT